MYCLRRGFTYPQAMEEVLKLGGDTDTNACIVGGLVGACWGKDGIKPEWIEAVLSYDSPKGGPRRPKFLIPKYHALKLVEGLVSIAPEKLTMVGSKKEYEIKDKQLKQ